jgi:hypothetical protein
MAEPTEPPSTPPTRVERYLAHVDRLSGGREPRFQPIGEPPGSDPLTSIIYHDLPGLGDLTALTYGLSLAEHPSWRYGKPELLISVRSTDIAWGLAIGHLAKSLRGRCPFTYGDTINFGRITAESAMTAFLIFAPTVLDRPDYEGIDVGDQIPVNLAGCYPIHQIEQEYIADEGLQKFWHLDWHAEDVTRPPAV